MGRGYSDIPNKDDHEIYDSDNVAVAVTTEANEDAVMVVHPMELGNGEGGNDNDEWTKGEIQAPQYRDKWFGIAFWIHFGIIMTVACMYMTGILETVAMEEEEIVEPAGDGSGGGGRSLLEVMASSSSSSSTSSSLAISAHQFLKRILLERMEEDDNDVADVRYDDLYGYNDNKDLYDSEDGIQVIDGTNYNNNNNGFTEDDDVDFMKGEGLPFLTTVVIVLIATPILSIWAFSLLRQHATKLIQTSLFFGIGANILLGVILVLFVDPISAIGPFIFAAILAWYTKAVWHRIPFAAANLKTAICAVQANLGIAGMGLLTIPLNIGWILLWMYTIVHVVDSPFMKSQMTMTEVTDDVYNFDTQQTEQQTHTEEELSGIGYLIWIGFVLSFYWTWQVIRNVFHTTVAGTIGTWWFLPIEASSCCSRGLMDSWSRSMTYSFGSICLGSLIVAILETVKTMVRSTARNRRGGIFRCVAQCILVWLERIAEYFNKWAFIYVGLYGYSYVEAGKNVFSLFRNRGWTTIISDTLVQRLLTMMCVAIALFVAIVAALLGAVGGFVDGDGGASFILDVLTGFFLALVVASNIFGIIGSAVDSIIVLYAEAPAELDENHPELAMDMKHTWHEAWPDVFTGGSATMASAAVIPGVV